MLESPSWNCRRFLQAHECMRGSFLIDLEILGINHGSILEVYTAEYTIEIKTETNSASLPSCYLPFHAFIF